MKTSQRTDAQVAQRSRSEAQALKEKLARSVFVAFLVASMILAFSLFTGAAQARVIVKESTKYYTVSGSNGLEIYRSIGLRSARGSGVQHAIATTTSSISITNIKTAIRRSRCVVTSAEVRLNLVYRYPRWRARGASSQVRRAWERFYAHAIRHEQQHGAISKKYANRMHRELLRTTGRVSRNCSDFGRNASRKFQRLASRLDSEQRRFDRREARSFSRNTRLQRALFIAR